MAKAVARFPQEHKVERMGESKRQYAARWKKYVKDLAYSAVPGRISGPKFGSKVRPSSRTRENNEKER